ncbi:MAG: hypothetical protein O2821_09380 [Chloroflexi bacterium]|nr:hypothetical protein [Chloroflexota bacterium]MDA1226688.1 hypothetical protein [Chloroflexota bacterium]
MTAKTGLGRLSQVRMIRELSWHEDMEHRPGVFLLRETVDGNVKYVGYSDSDLREYMLVKEEELVGRRFDFYNHRHANDADHAFEVACMFYHQYKKTLKRCLHPASPEGSSQGCPVHSCPV